MYEMKKSIFFGLALIMIVLAPTVGKAQLAPISVRAFDKVIISPHIEVTLIEGDQESVSIDNAKLPVEKINVEVEGKTLRVYLDGAKVITKSERIDNGDWKGHKSLYNGTMVTLTITFKKLNNISVRGEEIVHIASALQEKNMKLTIYGESKVYFDNLTVEKLKVAIYGSSYLEITDGAVQHQVYRAYGESVVNAAEIRNKSTKITAYGESDFRVKVSDNLRITCFGEATINYMGSPKIDKGIVIGEASIRKIG
tara:strand:- start:2062 stop:2823 length:762 start_codon:yes stop_codon:yes gene_type:complete